VKAFALQRIRKALSTAKTLEQLLQLTKIPERTLRYNLAALRKEGLLEETVVSSDFRKKIFKLKEVI